MLCFVIINSVAVFLTFLCFDLLFLSTGPAMFLKIASLKHFPLLRSPQPVFSHHNPDINCYTMMARPLSQSLQWMDGRYHTRLHCDLSSLPSRAFDVEPFSFFLSLLGGEVQSVFWPQSSFTFSVGPSWLLFVLLHRVCLLGWTEPTERSARSASTGSMFTTLYPTMPHWSEHKR